jgi:hypothetical protein
MIPQAPAFNSRQRARRAPLFGVHPRTCANIEVFYANRAVETFGRSGAGWFWWPRQRGFSPGGTPSGPFATSYAAYRHAMNAPAPKVGGDRRSHGGLLEP